MTLKSPRFLARIQAELRRFQVDPPPGVSCWLDDQYNEDRLDRLVAGKLFACVPIIFVFT
jgi:hypothetical protein